MFQEQQTIESLEKRTEVTLDAAVEEAVRVWAEIKDLEPKEFCKKYNPNITLSPTQIQQLLTRTEGNQNNNFRGLYISNAISNSIEAGHKDFTLESNETISNINIFGKMNTLMLKGRFGHTICVNADELTNYANCGNSFAIITKGNKKITDHGTCTDLFGAGSEYAEFTNYGAIGDYAFQHAMHIKVINFGTIKSISSWKNSRDHQTTLLRDSLLSTIHPNEYKVWCETLHPTNTIQLIDANRNVIESYKKKD